MYTNLDNRPSETSPLLPEDHVDGCSSQEHASVKTTKRSPRMIILAIFITILLTSFGDKLAESPQQRLKESVICYEYYEKTDRSKLMASRENAGPGAISGVAEMYCKVDDVQDKLAMLNGYQVTFDGLPSLILALPFGWAADKYGRRPILFAGLLAFAVKLSITQSFLWFWQTFDIELIWLSSITGLLGGGGTVTSGLCIAAIADVTRTDERATIFLQLAASNLGADLVMPPLAAWLMDINPWIPCLGGTLFMLVAAALYATIPETLGYLENRGSDVGSLAEECSPTNVDESETRFDSNKCSVPLKPSQTFHDKLKSVRSAFTRDWRVPGLILTYLSHNLAGASATLTLQFVSKRCMVNFSTATLLLTVRAAGNMVLLLVILPYLSHLLLKRWNLSGQKKDLLLSRVSAILWALGFYMIGLSPNVPAVVIALTVGSLGIGAMMLIRAFLTSLLPGNQIARAYACISLVDTIGGMLGSPLLAALFHVGLKLGNSWMGLPFLFLGLVITAVAGVTFAVGLRDGEDEVSPT